VWSGYAVEVVSRTGERRVVIGPQTVLLGYNETLGVLTLSTGTPKSDEHPLRTVYLLVHNNKVSDEVVAVTGDLVEVQVTLSYRVNFEGDPNRWFSVENYIKLLTEHLRSLLRYAIKQHGIEDFNRNHTSLIRDAILGLPTDGNGKRPGRAFDENGMRVYDVEVLDVEIGDERIADMLIQAQHDSVRQALEVAQAQRGLETTRRLEEIQREVAREQAETEQRQFQLAQERIAAQLAQDLAKIGAEAQAREAQLTAQLADQARLSEIGQAELARDKAREDQRLALRQEEQRQALAQLEAEVQAVVQRAQALGPEVVAALQAFADKRLAAEVAQSMSPLAILGGDSVVGVVQRLLQGTVLEKALSLGEDRDNDTP
jgi:major vault protein